MARKRCRHGRDPDTGNCNPRPRRPNRAGQEGMTPSGKRWSRSMHESFALDDIRLAQSDLRFVNCDSYGVYAAVKANRSIAQARAHLASIGPDAGPRVRKYWKLASKVTKQVDAANNKLASCFVQGSR